MAVRVKYGGYLHAVGDPSVDIQRRMAETPGGTPYEDGVIWNIAGELQSTTSSGLRAQIAALEAGYSRNGLDAVIYDDQTGDVFHALYNAITARGVRVTARPSYPSGDGTELVNRRSYRLQIAAEFPLIPGAAILKSWTESLRFTGGGQKRGFIRAINTDAIPVINSVAEPYSVIQSGAAVGYFSPPPGPKIIWPDALLEAPAIVPTAPQWSNGRFTDFGLSWTLIYGSTTPLVGNPTAMKTG